MVQIAFNLKYIIYSILFCLAVQGIDRRHTGFSFVDILPYLDENNRTKPSISWLLLQFSADMHRDAMAFASFRLGTQHKSLLHAYLSFLYNLYRESRIYYPSASPIWCSYSCDAFKAIMDVNLVD